VYYSNGRVLQQVTVDHTVAEYFRARAREVTPRMEHLVTTSVQTVKPEWIGVTRTSVATGRLLLCSDGVHRSLSAPDIRTVLDQPFGPDTAARLLVDRALDHGGRDNCTALVVDHGIADLSAAAA
jgi:protein phosphatase